MSLDKRTKIASDLDLKAYKKTIYDLIDCEPLITPGLWNLVEFGSPGLTKMAKNRFDQSPYTYSNR